MKRETEREGRSKRGAKGRAKEESKGRRKRERQHERGDRSAAGRAAASRPFYKDAKTEKSKNFFNIFNEILTFLKFCVIIKGRIYNKE